MTINLSIMKVSIVSAAIVFQLCQLINCINVDSCEESPYGSRECLLTVPSLSSQLKVECFELRLTVHPVDPNSRNISINNYNFPSVKNLWQKCIGDNHSQGYQDEINLTEIDLGKIGITAYPDYYFCNLPNLKTVMISKNSLNDSTKLGFSSMENCDNRCSTKVDTLFASANDFEKLFNNSFCGLQHVTMLYLVDSSIKELEIDAFINLKSLQILELSHNYISMISPGVFRKQENILKGLYLAENHLNSRSLQGLKTLHKLESIQLDSNQIDIFPDEILNGMNHLKFLYMRNNMLKTLPGSQTYMGHLENLDITNNSNSVNFSRNPKTYSNITTLESIELPNAVLSTVPNSMFIMEKLTNILLPHNRIDKIEANTFLGGQNIVSIDLSYNRLADITNAFTNCTVEFLNLGHNRLTKLSFTDYGFRLKSLKVTYNHIHTIDSGVEGVDVAMIENRWTLENIDLSHNHFNELRRLSLPRSVSDFNLKNNNISFISYTNSYLKLMDSGLIKLQVSLVNNAFIVICPSFVPNTNQTRVQYNFRGNPLRCLCDNDWLSPSRIKEELEGLKQDMIDDRPILTCRPTFQRQGNNHLSIVDLEDRDFLCISNYTCNNDVIWNKTFQSDDCPRQCACYNNDRIRLVHIDCSSKNILTLPLQPPYMDYDVRKLFVYLDNNSIHQTDASSFMGLQSTTALYLNHTGLSKMEDGSFDQLTLLNILHLGHNNLTYISEKIFTRLRRLTRLFLSHNQLQIVEPNAFPLQLQTLHLDNNQVVNYSVWQLHNLTEVNLQGNRWSCECQFIEKFRNWLLKYSHGVSMLEKLFCVLPTDDKLEMPLIDLTSEHCYNATVVNILTSDNAEVWMWVLGVFACLTITSVMIFYFRREAQVLIYSRLGVRLFYRGERDELEGKYFDAFIAYSCVDEDFLVNRLMPGLERINEPYKLCLHHRNFLGGASIIHSIMEAVEFSTRTIILLSDNFMRSEWCRFEFQQAYIQMLKDRCNRLLVIVIDEIPTDLDPEMRVYLRTNTYIKWGDRLFWKKLYFAMPERVQPRLAERHLAQQRGPTEDRVITQELQMGIMQ